MNVPSALHAPDSPEYRTALVELIEDCSQHTLAAGERATATFAPRTAATLATFAAIGAAARLAAGLACLTAKAERRGVHQAEVDHLVGTFRGLLLDVIADEGSSVSAARN